MLSQNRAFGWKRRFQNRGFNKRHRTMTHLNGELSPPFEIIEPAVWRAPIIFNSPHSGSVYPHEFLKASRVGFRWLRRSEGFFKGGLIFGFGGRGFPAGKVKFPRSYVDV